MVRWIKQHLKHAKTSGGISNVSFASETIRYEAIHSVFLFHAIRAGLDMGIVNRNVADLRRNSEGFSGESESLVLNKEQASEEFMGIAQTLKNRMSKEDRKDAWRELPVEKRLEHALVKGLPDFIKKIWPKRCLIIHQS